MSGDDAILLFQILYGVTALGTMIIVISENRNPVKTISWVLILLLLPLVGLFFYYFFGEDNRKKRLISHKTHKKLRKTQGVHYKEEGVVVPQKYEGLITLLNSEEYTSLYGGSDVLFYKTGQEKFDALFDAIQNAQETIHIQYYIFMDDKLGSSLAALLKQKAQEGLEVRLIYDDVGSWKVKRKFFDDLEVHGVEVQSFLKVKFRWLTSRVNYRNHRKVVVIDGRIGFMGGMNVADRYVDGVNFGVWRDSHIKIEGLAVAALQTDFLIDWYSSRGELLSDMKYYPKLEPKGNCHLQLVTSGPVGQFKMIHNGIVQAISIAEKSVLIQTPYFIPTDAMILAIQLAAMRGVDVKLMVPKKSDTTFVHVASMSFLTEVIDAGADVFLFDIGFLHSKLIVIDDDLVITGSANMDIRSFEHNFEINAFIYDKSINKVAREIFFNDVKSSKKIKVEEWEKRSRQTKFNESVMRLFSPLL